MKKNTTVWIIVNKDGKPVGEDVLDAAFLKKAHPVKVANRWNKNPIPGDVRPYTVRRATLVLDDPA